MTSRAPRPVPSTGARVRILEGPCAGKIGVLGAVDERGFARVQLGDGGIVARVPVAAVEPVALAAERPTLRASHRRPAFGGRSGGK